jgi:hypothetical protein
MLDLGLYLIFRLTREWGFTGGYRLYARDIETDELTNRARFDTPFLAVSHSWY